MHVMFDELSAWDLDKVVVDIVRSVVAPVALEFPEDPDVEWLQLMSSMWWEAQYVDIVCLSQDTHLARDMGSVSIHDE